MFEGMPTRIPITPDTSGRTEITGIPVSPGVVSGIARVVIDPAVADLEPDEILVCRTTDPGWASIMILASALVIDIGGPVSHGAIVARELGIPCVIGTASGSRVIRTGDHLTVDGATGVVRIHRPGAGTPARDQPT
jgi:pyruvate,water dikinase